MSILDKIFPKKPDPLPSPAVVACLCYVEAFRRLGIGSRAYARDGWARVQAEQDGKLYERKVASIEDAFEFVNEFRLAVGTFDLSKPLWLSAWAESEACRESFSLVMELVDAGFSIKEGAGV